MVGNVKVHLKNVARNFFFTFNVYSVIVSNKYRTKQKFNRGFRGLLDIVISNDGKLIMQVAQSGLSLVAQLACRPRLVLFD
jgi:hypothetical protein